MFDEGLIVRIEKPGEEGWSIAKYLKVANGTSNPQIRFFTEQRWAKQVASRETPEGCRAILSYGFLVEEKVFGQAIQTGFVYSSEINGIVYYNKESHGYGNRPYTKLYSRKRKIVGKNNQLQCYEAKFIESKEFKESLLQ